MGTWCGVGHLLVFHVTRGWCDPEAERSLGAVGYSPTPGAPEDTMTRTAAAAPHYAAVLLSSTGSTLHLTITLHIYDSIICMHMLQWRILNLKHLTSLPAFKAQYR